MRQIVRDVPLMEELAELSSCRDTRAELEKEEEDSLEATRGEGREERADSRSAAGLDEAEEGEQLTPGERRSNVDVEGIWPARRLSSPSDLGSATSARARYQRTACASWLTCQQYSDYGTVRSVSPNSSRAVREAEDRSSRRMKERPRQRSSTSRGREVTFVTGALSGYRSPEFTRSSPPPPLIRRRLPRGGWFRE